jgi:predicted nucleotidyltransferase
MNVLGIVAEYNPFHNGHLLHLNRSAQLTEADVTVAVMSGNFVQRGEPAMLNKWIRSEMAVRNGVDLVLELPFVYACNSAEIFAKGAVGLLDGLGCVDSICFGSEAGEIEPLSHIADLLNEETPDFSLNLKEKMGEGLSYPKARQEALADIVGKGVADILSSPNNILGIEYLRELKRLNSSIHPFTIKRESALIDQVNEEDKIAGATAIRRLIDEGRLSDACEYLPKSSLDIFNNNLSGLAQLESFKALIIYSIISKSKEELANVYSITEGLENKIIKSAKEASSIAELIALIKSKRYTETRIRRILMHTLMNLSRDKMNKILEENQMYTRILAFNNKGADLLKMIKKEECSNIPVITNISKESDRLDYCMDLFNYDVLATDIYNLVVSNRVYEESDYRQVPKYIEIIPRVSSSVQKN